MLSQVSPHFIVHSYASRIQAAELIPPDAFARSSEREPVAVLSATGEATGQFVASGAAHRLGIIHRTADVLAADGNGHVLLQKRSAIDPMFPSYFTLSAGGHCLGAESPLETARRELQEEVGLWVSDLSRLIPIQHLPDGIPNFYRECHSQAPSEKLWQFAPRGEWHAAPRAPNAPDVAWPSEWEDWRKSLAHPSKEGAILAFLNQEFTFYYLLVLSKSELAEIDCGGDSHYPMGAVSLDEFASLCQDPLRATDGLRCLSAPSVVPYLRRLIYGSRQ